MSCLFQSLATFVKVSADDLRRQTCQYLSTDPVIIQPDAKASDVIKFQPDIPSSTLEEYVRAMSFQNTNGGAIEIVVFCSLYSRNVRVVQCGTRQGNMPIEFISNLSNPWITISWNGGHYEPSYEPA